MDIDPYLPVQQLKVVVLSVAAGCFMVMIIVDAWFEYRKQKLQQQDKPTSPKLDEISDKID